MTAEIVQLTPAPELDPFEQFWDAYPRKDCKGFARARWIWALAKADNNHHSIIDGAKRFAAYHLKEGTERRFLLRPDRWLDAEGWLDSYELPKAPVASPHEQEQARLKHLADKWWPRGVVATRFVRDHRRDHISDADKRAIVAMGIRTAEEME